MSDLTEQLRSLAKSNTRREEGEDWRDKIEWKAADEIDRLNRELAEARDKALEEAAKVADAHASTCLSKLNKKRSDHDLAVFESAASEAQSIAHVVRALKEKP